jgi:hypothetical protein
MEVSCTQRILSNCVRGWQRLTMNRGFCLLAIEGSKDWPHTEATIYRQYSLVYTNTCSRGFWIPDLESGGGCLHIDICSKSYYSYRLAEADCKLKSTKEASVNCACLRDWKRPTLSKHLHIVEATVCIPVWKARRGWWCINIYRWAFWLSE